MASKRDYCCFCIPLRLAVFIISVIAIALGGLSLWTGLSSSKEDQSSKIAAYISTVVYGILGLSGLLCVLYKKYGLAKNFSNLWWAVTIAVTLLAICKLIFVGVSSKDYIRSVCQQELLLTDKYNGSFGDVDAGQLNDDVDSCYRTVMMMGGIALAVQLLVMSLCGWVASRYTSEVRYQHDVEQQQQQQQQQGGYTDPYILKV